MILKSYLIDSKHHFKSNKIIPVQKVNEKTVERGSDWKYIISSCLSHDKDKLGSCTDLTKTEIQRMSDLLSVYCSSLDTTAAGWNTKEMIANLYNPSVFSPSLDRKSNDTHHFSLLLPPNGIITIEWVLQLVDVEPRWSNEAAPSSVRRCWKGATRSRAKGRPLSMPSSACPRPRTTSYGNLA